ncbi:MAG: PAS domain-containing protein [Planctomycetes bacterium]|nr:PAS domain-containing protein [Planctomycetota bacterium]
MTNLADNSHVNEELIRTLLVEDNPADTRIMEMTLSDISGVKFELLTAATLSQASQLVADRRFDVILLDLSLPDSRGIETFRAMKSAAKGIPIVVMSGLPDDQVAMEAVRNGAQDYLVKGHVGADVLVRSMRYAIQRRRGEESFHDLEQEKAYILDSMSEYLVHMDANMQVRWLNKAALDAVGLPMDKVCGLRCQVWCGQEKPCGGCPAAKAIKSGKPVEGERVFRDGRIWACRASPIRDAAGNITGVLETATDVTDRKRTEEALGWGRHLLGTLMDNVPDYIYFKDAQGRFIRVNKAMAGKLGLADPAQASGKTDADYHPPEQARQAALDEQQVMQTCQPIVSKEEQTIWPDGSLTWASITKMPLIDREGKVIGTFGLSRDITVHKNVEDTLRESEARFRQLFDDSPAGYHELDMEGRIIQVNRTELKMLGYSAQEMLGRFAWEFFEGQTAKAIILGKLSGKIHAGKAFERNLICKDGSLMPAIIDDKILYDKEDSIIGMRVTLTDISERRLAEEMFQRQLQRLGALRDVDMAINASMDLRLTLPVLLEKLTLALQVDAANILLLSAYTQTLEYASGRGFRTELIKHTRLRLGEGHPGSAAIERRTMTVPDLRDTSVVFGRQDLIEAEEFVSYFCVPLVAKGQIKGVIEIFNRSPKPAEPEWLEFLETLAGQAAMAIDNAAMFDNLQRSNIDLVLAYDYTIEGWSRALELRDAETEGHAARVTDMTVQLGRMMGLREDELAHVRRGALLHDIGKMGVPDSILLKPGPLNDEEWVVMKKHPGHAYEMLSTVSYLKQAMDIPYCHHEKWDGTGYPRGLKGEYIPMAARIFAIIDVWDALSSARPYRAAWPDEKVLAYIQSNTGTHFDPEVAQTFLRVYPNLKASYARAANAAQVNLTQKAV